MQPSEIRAALNLPVRFTNKKLYIEGAEYMFTGAIFRKGWKGFYYQAELTDMTVKNSVLICGLNDIETVSSHGENEYANERGWISVGDYLPDDEKIVLVWYEYFRYGDYNCMYQTYGLARYVQRYDMWSGDDMNGDRVKVLYWQPLPEPPDREEGLN
jgi:hypothetical protein